MDRRTIRGAVWQESRRSLFPELLTGLSKWENDLSDDPTKRPFAHLQRDKEGKFNDDDLARIMQSAIEDVAGKTLSILVELVALLTR